MTTYTLPEPTFEFPSLCRYNGSEMEAAYQQGQRDMREAAAKVCNESPFSSASVIEDAINSLPIGESHE